MYKCLLIILFSSVFHKGWAQSHVDVQWENKVEGDFSFTDKWDYPEGVYINRHGQVSCDGFCPNRLWGMKDSTGKVFKDSLDDFYELLDTSHQYHSMQLDSVRSYQYHDTYYLDCHLTDSSVHCETRNINGLVIDFGEETHAHVVFISVVAGTEKQIFKLDKGIIKLDKKAWNQEQGSVKGYLDLTFINHLDPKNPVYFRGLVHSNIEQSGTKHE